MRGTTKLALAATVAALAAAAFVLFPTSGAKPVPSEVDNDFCVVAPATPYEAASGLPMLAPKTVPDDARCPVCGMYPGRFPHWAAQVVFRDGASQFFDSPVDLLVFLARIERYNPSYAAADVAGRFVTDADTGKWTALEQAYFVHGSNALGPMRDGDLPAFASRDQAERFAVQNGGRVLKHSEIAAAELGVLSRNRRHHH